MWPAQGGSTDYSIQIETSDCGAPSMERSNDPRRNFDELVRDLQACTGRRADFLIGQLQWPGEHLAHRFEGCRG